MFYLIDRKTEEVFATESAILADMLTRRGCHVCSKEKFERDWTKRLQRASLRWRLRMIQRELIRLS